MIPRAAAWVGLTCLFSWPACALPGLFGAEVDGVWLFAISIPYILAPFASSWVWRRIYARGEVHDLGESLQFSAALWQAWLLPIALLWLSALVAHLLGWGVIDLSGDSIAARIAAVRPAEDAEIAREQLAAASLPYPVLASFQGLVVGLLFAPIWYGAELGWRGLLLRELRGLGFWNAAALSGLLWGVWRLPLLVTGQFLPGDPFPAATLMLAGSLPLGALLAWVRVRAGTIWASAITLSVLTTVGRFDELILDGGTALQTSPLGLAGGLTALALAVGLFALHPRGPVPATLSHVHPGD